MLRFENHGANLHTSKVEKTIKFYNGIIDRVIHHCPQDFEDDGGGSEALAVFKDLWKSKLKPVMEEQKHKASSQAKLPQFRSYHSEHIRFLPRHQNTPGRFAQYAYQRSRQQQFQRQGLHSQHKALRQLQMRFVTNRHTGTSASSSNSMLPSSQFLPMTIAPQQQLVQLQVQGRMSSIDSSAQLQKLTLNSAGSDIQKQLNNTTSRSIFLKKAPPSGLATNNASTKVVIHKRIKIGSKPDTSVNPMKVVRNENGEDVRQLDGTNDGKDYNNKLKKATWARKKEIVRKKRNNDSSSESEIEDDSESDEDSEEDNSKNEDESEELYPDEQRSDDEITSEEDPEEMFETDHEIVCQYSKVVVTKKEWKMNLLGGIMKLDGVDTVFKGGHTNIEW